MVAGGLSAILRSKAIRKGLVGGSRGWTAVGVVVYGWKLLRWWSNRRPEVVAVELIEPGQTLQISTVAAASRRRRRAAARP